MRQLTVGEKTKCVGGHTGCKQMNGRIKIGDCKKKQKGNIILKVSEEE